MVGSESEKLSNAFVSNWNYEYRYARRSSTHNKPLLPATIRHLLLIINAKQGQQSTQVMDRVEDAHQIGNERVRDEHGGQEHTGLTVPLQGRHIGARLRDG